MTSTAGHHETLLLRRAPLAALVLCLPLASGCASAKPAALSAADAATYTAMSPRAASEPAEASAGPSSEQVGAVAPAAAKAPPPAPRGTAHKASAGSGVASPSAASDQQAKSAGDRPKLDPASAPLLIYQGALALEVPKSDMSTVLERAIDVSESFGGYLVSRSDAGAELRVPSQSFRPALKALAELGHVTRRSVSAQDVSEEYHDLGVRLKNLEAVRDRLEQFLARATNVDEALRVGQELAKVASQIDQIKGRMQYLKTRAAYSSIVLSLQPEPEKKIVAKPAPPIAPPARPARMPVTWLGRVGLNRLLTLD